MTDQERLNQEKKIQLEDEIDPEDRVVFDKSKAPPIFAAAVEKGNYEFLKQMEQMAEENAQQKKIENEQKKKEQQALIEKAIKEQQKVENYVNTKGLTSITRKCGQEVVDMLKNGVTDAEKYNNQHIQIMDFSLTSPYSAANTQTQKREPSINTGALGELFNGNKSAKTESESGAPKQKANQFSALAQMANQQFNHQN